MTDDEKRSRLAELERRLMKLRIRRWKLADFWLRKESRGNLNGGSSSDERVSEYQRRFGGVK